jgi:serine/threonine protein kinase
VKLLKDASLGVGSYGAVCKAKCDDLICAAKVLQLLMFSDKDEKLLHLINQECQLLSSLQHPNIVQYLGTWKDPTTNHPVLLMELMDQNLTQLLERSGKPPLTFHMQVNICHDISLALSFLHSNDIIHRDLSSNNVLMIGDRRAKVTDFGMAARLWDTKSPGSLSKCPGCAEYMSPEAFSGSYSTKLDCFSYGVLVIQILTGLFPQPGKQFKVVHISDPNFPNGIETRATEAERRKAHLDMIQPDHPLLPIAMDCIGDKEADRPSSADLCGRLTGVKEAARYLESVNMTNTDRLFEDIEKQVMDLQDLSLPSIDGDSMSSVKCASTTGVVVTASPSEATPTDSRGEQEKQIEALQLKISTLQSKEVLMKNETERLREELKSRLKELEAQKSQLDSFQGQDPSLEEKVQELEKQLKLSQQTVSSMTDDTGPMELKRIKLEWMKQSKAPCKLSRTDEAVATTESAVFIRPGGSTDIYSYSITADCWSKFPGAPVSDCGLAVIKRKLTIIGGKKDGHFTSRLLSLVETAGKKEWITIYPSMSTQRSSPIVLHCQGSLVVAGGEGESGYLKTVEVLNTDTSVWQRVADLLEPLVFGSATITGTQLYILGGWVEKMVSCYSILSCSLESLLQSEQSLSDASLETEKQASPWNRLTDLPLKGATCVSVRGRLLAIGGRDMHKPLSTIHAYNPLSNSWEVLTYMSHPRHQCYATVLDRKLMVLGGWKLNDKQVMTETSTVETATVLS